MPFELADVNARGAPIEILGPEHEALRDPDTQRLGQVEGQIILWASMLLHMFQPGVPGFSMKRVGLSELGRHLVAVAFYPLELDCCVCLCVLCRVMSSTRS